MTIKEIRSLTGLTQEKFSEKYHIPKRTIGNWETGVNVPPEYVVELLEYRVKSEYKKEIEQ